MKAQISIKQVLLLQAVVVIYTVSGVMAKFASASEGIGKLLLFLGLDVFFLGIYALFWQQMIKNIPLSVAYANRAMAMLWSALWALLIFGEKIGGRQMAGIALVIVGICIINSDKGRGGETE